MSRWHSLQTGYVALLAVLVVGAASLAICTTLLLTATDSQRSTLTSQESAQARTLAAACGEEGLQKIYESTSYTGTTAVAIGCSFTVTNTGGNNRTVVGSATVGTSTRRVTINATIGATNITVSSWLDSQ